jgi:hypothetical protein
MIPCSLRGMSLRIFTEHQGFGVPFPALGTRYHLLEDQLAILHGTWSASETTPTHRARRPGRVPVGSTGRFGI